MRNKNIQNPPDEVMSFKNLINYIWDHGLGNRLTPDAVPMPWKPETFESAFFDIGFDVDIRSFQNWRGGVHKADRKNIHAIARVVSGGDPHIQKEWAIKLIDAPKIDESDINSDSKGKIEKFSQKSNFKDLFFKYRLFITGLVLGQIPLLAVILFSYSSGRGQTTITDLKFCDEAGFSKTAMKCHNPASHFPSGTGRIYVSFDFNNSYMGQPFERRWYQNSEMFLSKKSFNDTAWPGYTFISQEDGMKDAKYDLRVIVDDSTTTKSFIVGQFDPSHVHPDIDPT